MRNNLEKDKIFPLILKLAIPSMLAQFVNVLYSIVDRIFISNISGYGDVALAGVGVCGPIVTLITSFCFLLGLGGAPLMAMKMGEKNNIAAEKILFNCFFLLTVFSVGLTAILLIFKNNMLMFFGASENTFKYANQYMTIYVLGSVFALLSLGLNNFITCQGYSKTAMITIVIGAVVNIILDPLFIFVFKMGVSGAAIATVIAQFISCIWVILFLIGKKPMVRLKLQKISKAIMSRVLKNGLSPFIIIATDSVIVILLNMALKSSGGVEFGDLYITSATIVISYMQLITLPMGGITMACQPIVSYNYGAKQSKRVKTAIIGTLGMCLIFTIIMTIISIAVPHLFVGIFTNASDVMSISVWGIKVYTSAVIILSVQYACVDLLVALGSTTIAVMLSLLRKIGLMMPFVLLLPKLLGYKGAFYAEPLADVIGSVVSGIVFLLVIKKILKKRESAVITNEFN